MGVSEDWAVPVKRGVSYFEGHTETTAFWETPLKYPLRWGCGSFDRQRLGLRLVQD